MGGHLLICCLVLPFNPAGFGVQPRRGDDGEEDLTPMLMISLTSGEDAGAALDLTVGGVHHTLISVAVAVVLVLLLGVWDRRAESVERPGPDRSQP